MVTPEKVPEWDIFERLEKLEKLESLKPTVSDTSILATYGVILNFIEMVTDDPSHARKFQDAFIRGLKELGLSRKTLEALERILVDICEIIES